MLHVLCESYVNGGEFTLKMCDAQVFKIKNSKVIC